MNMLLPAITILCAILLCAEVRAEIVNVYTSANIAPLVSADGRGLYADLVAHLNRQKLGELSFKLIYLPRKRLQVKLEEGSIDGVVIGMMPEWFGDAAQTKYLWTVPFAQDRMVLVSRTARPLNADVPATLDGASVGVTLGYVYPRVDALLHKYHAVRSNALSDEKNLEKLLFGRLDGVLVGEAVARYFIKSRGQANALQLTVLPGADTERRFLAPRSQEAAFDKLAPAVRKLKDDPLWQRIAAGYR
jgi:polar amino acid transport system substrate-binding protein